MRLRTVLIGILVVVLAFVVGSVAFPSVILGLGNFAGSNIIAAPMRASYLQLNVINSSSLVIVTYHSNVSVDFYFANESAFVQLVPYLNSTNLTQKASALQGNGILLSYTNSLVGGFPYSKQANVGLPPSFSVPNITTLQAGNYYLLFSNHGASEANVTIVRGVLPNPRSNVIALGILGIVVLAIFFIGIGLIIYGIIKKPKSKQETPVVSEEEVDRLYKNVGGDAKRRKIDKKGKRNR